MSVFRRKKIGRSTSSLSIDDPSLLSAGLNGTRQLKMQLGETELVFQDGVWTAEGVAAGAGSSKDGKALKKENKRLKEQNNMLQCKVDLLVDMLAAARLDMQALRQEIDVANRGQR